MNRRLVKGVVYVLNLEADKQLFLCKRMFLFLGNILLLLKNI